MGWDALHLSLLNGGSEVAIKGSKTWLCCSFFPLQFCISEQLLYLSVLENGAFKFFKKFVFIKNLNECFF